MIFIKENNDLDIKKISLSKEKNTQFHYDSNDFKEFIAFLESNGVNKDILLSPSDEDIKLILVLTERFYLEASSHLDDAILNLDKATQLMESYTNEKSMYNKPEKNTLTDLAHKVYDDGKSLVTGVLGSVIPFVLIIALISDAGNKDDFEENNKVLVNLVDEFSYESVEADMPLILNDIEFDTEYLNIINKEVKSVIATGFVSEDEDYIKSIYIKSLILKSSYDSLGVKNKDIDNLINDILKKID